MNPYNLFKIWFETTNPIGEILEINGKNVYRTHNSTTYYDIERDKTYLRIQSCINNRNKSKKGLFSCSCGVCNAYLMTELYNNTFKRSSEIILDEVLNEMFTNTVQTPSTPATYNTPIIPNPVKSIPVKSNPVKSNPLDNMILTFGKHKDKTYKEIFGSDKEYCMWCIESLAIERSKGSRVNNDMVAFVGYIKQQITKL
jgi:hypothetical protein